jgi:hypothetical protein
MAIAPEPYSIWLTLSGTALCGIMIAAQARTTRKLVKLSSATRSLFSTYWCCTVVLARSAKILATV